MKAARFLASRSDDQQPQISRRAAVKTVAGLSLGAVLLPAQTGKVLAQTSSSQYRMAEAV